MFVVFAIAYFSLQEQKEHYIERFETSWHSMSYSLSSSVWTYDLKSIKSTIDSYARVWDVTGIQVLDQYDTVLSSVGTTTDSEQANLRVLPLYEEGMSKIGEIRLWLPVNTTIGEEFHSTILRTTFFVSLLLLLSSFLVYRTLRQHVLSALKNTSTLLQSDLRQPPTELYFGKMPDEIREIAEFVAAEKNQLIGMLESLKFDLGHETDLANSLQSLLSESDQTCVVLGDAGQILIRNLSAPFSEQELPVLVDIVSNVIDPVAGLTGAGFDVHRVFTGRENSVAKSFEVVSTSGETLMVKIFRLQNSSRALLAYNVSHAKWSDLLIDELLGLSQSGLAIFDRGGRLQMEKGESVTRLLSNYGGHVEVNLARVLLEFPKIGSDADNGPVSFEHRLPDDRVYQVHFSQHEQSGIGITHHDVTEERRVERHLIESQRLNDLGRIASGVAHDFNNSLGVVIGQLELASDSAEWSKKSRHIETALTAASQSANVVKQLMTYSRKQPQDPVVIALDKIIDEQKNVFASAVGGGVSIYYDLAFGGIVCLDVELFTSVLLNLFINAGDAMDGHGSVFVTTSRERRPDGKRQMIVLSIQDTGPGIPEGVIKEIFLPFFTTKKNNIGNGLGLSMVLGFVDQLAGRIKVENNDVGACFHLYLPEHEDIPTGQTVGIELPTVQSWKQQISNSKSIMVMVDDNELLLDTNVQLLRAQGATVQGFHDCLEAISFIAESTSVGCVLVDMKMPQMSGLEFVDRILEYIDSEKIILYSGNFDKHDIELARKRGVRKVLRKPLTSGQMFEAFEKCIRLYRPQIEERGLPAEEVIQGE